MQSVSREGMEQSDIAEMLETRRVDENLNESLTVCHSHTVTITHEGEPQNGELRVEYKPEDLRLKEQEGLERLAEETKFFHEFYPEVMVNQLYEALVDILYTKHSYIDNPEQTLPLVVSLEFETAEHTQSLVSVGTYR